MDVNFGGTLFSPILTIIYRVDVDKLISNDQCPTTIQRATQIFLMTKKSSSSSWIILIFFLFKNPLCNNDHTLLRPSSSLESVYGSWFWFVKPRHMYMSFAQDFPKTQDISPKNSRQQRGADWDTVCEAGPQGWETSRIHPLPRFSEIMNSIRKSVQ